jgi:hypothetical protein
MSAGRLHITEVGAVQNGLAYLWGYECSQNAGTTLTWTFSFPIYPGSQVIVPVVTSFDTEVTWGATSTTFPYGDVYPTYAIAITVKSTGAAGASLDICGLDIGSVNC